MDQARNARFAGVLLLLAALATCAASGCACALPHEHVQVLADDAERFVELWRIEHTTGLTVEQLERQLGMADRLATRAALVRRGLAAEGKAIAGADTSRGNLK